MIGLIMLPIVPPSAAKMTSSSSARCMSRPTYFSKEHAVANDWRSASHRVGRPLRHCRRPCPGRSTLYLSFHFYFFLNVFI
uniref:Uncharacterized protein n=1 Tax=Triticum urartu TaxID=4572 RepID=A0A8R7QC35_TRIUA